jgi:hypothetical protein
MGSLSKTGSLTLKLNGLFLEKDMIQKIRELLRAVSFVPFKIKTSDGSEFLVPTADHAAITPQNSRVLVFGDDESQKTLSGLHIVAVEETASSVR